MSFTTIKISTADREFSLYVRELHGYGCERCGKICRMHGEWIARLEASHYFSRSHRSLRFNTDNVRSLCGACHRRMGGYQRDEQGEYDLWMKAKLGEDRYKQLKLEANRYQLKDEKMELLYVRQLEREMGEKDR
jgi:hypothetical protein